MKYINSLAVLVAVGAAVSASAAFTVGQAVSLTVASAGMPKQSEGDVKATISYGMYSGTYRIGDFDVTAVVPPTPGSFQAFCADIGSVVIAGAGSYSYQEAQWLGEPTPPSWAGLVSGTTAEQRAAWVAQTYYGLNGLDVTIPGSYNSSIQLAIWEALYETSGTFDITAGAFSATSTANADANLILSDLQSELANAPGNVAAFVPSLFYPINANGRPLDNQVLIATEFLGVPEPSTYAMAFAGLLGAFAVSRRMVKK